MFNEELIAAKVAARNAGKILIKHLESYSQDIEYKKDSGNSPVTAADYEADQYLAKYLLFHCISLHYLLFNAFCIFNSFSSITEQRHKDTETQRHRDPPK